MRTEAPARPRVTPQAPIAAAPVPGPPSTRHPFRRRAARLWHDVLTTPGRMTAFTVAAILTVLARLAWDNDAFVADSIGVYLDTGADVMLDLTTVGFAHSTPRNDALFERFGPPAVDPDWEP